MLEVDEKTAKEIMVPRTEMVALPSDATVSEIIERMRESGHSRYPVYDGTPDHIAGMLYVKDLLRAIAQEGADSVQIWTLSAPS